MSGRCFRLSVYCDILLGIDLVEVCHLWSAGKADMWESYGLGGSAHLPLIGWFTILVCLGLPCFNIEKSCILGNPSLLGKGMWFISLANYSHTQINTPLANPDLFKDIGESSANIIPTFLLTLQAQCWVPCTWSINTVDVADIPLTLLIPFDTNVPIL